MATFTVTNSTDTPAAGSLTLREAVGQSSAGDTIVFAESIDTIVLGGSDISFRHSLTISGDVTIDGNGQSRIFTIPQSSVSSTVVLQGLTLVGGNGSSATASGAGGAIIAYDAVELVGIDLTFAGNEASDRGGAIYADGGLSLTDCAFTNNMSGRDGGAVYAGGEEVELVRCEFVGNASASGGALFANWTAVISSTDTTFAENSADSLGGAIYLSADATFTNTTIVGNTVNGGGGAISAGSGELALINSTITGNSATGSGGAIGAGNGVIVATNSLILGNASLSEDIDFSGTLTNNASIIGGDATTIFETTEEIGSTGVRGGVQADNGGPVQTVALLNDPSNPAIDAGESGTPAADARGQDRFDIAGVANNGDSIVDLGAFELEFNAPPVLDNPIADVASVEDEAISFTVPADTFADPNGDPLTLTAALANGDPLPDWLAFDGTTFSGTPPQDFNGTVSLTVTASDGEESVSDTFDLEVTPVNDAPTIVTPLADAASPEDEEFVQLVPRDSFADVDGDDLDFTATLADGSPLPDWLRTEEEPEGLFVFGTPPQDFNGTVDIRVTASDGALTASDTFELAITPVNDAPVLANPIADFTSPEDQEVFAFIPRDTFEDVDGDTLRVSFRLEDGSLLPDWLNTDSEPEGFYLFGTPPQDFNGTLTIRALATDVPFGMVPTEPSFASDTFELTITPVNDAPTIVTPLADAASPEDEEFVQLVPRDSFADVDGDDLDFTATLADGSPLPDWLRTEEEPEGLFVFGTPPQDFNGTLDIRVTASDGELTASDTFELAITNVNDAPVASDDLATTTGGAPLTIAAGTLLANDGDIDGDALAIASVESGANGTVVLGEGGTVTFTPEDGFFGRTSFSYTISDGSGAENGQDTATVDVIVYRPDDGDGDDLFDTAFYLEQNADVAAAGVDALEHFREFGWREGRDPNAVFDTSGYLAVNGDVAAAGINPLEHYRVFGGAEERDASIDFDTGLYLLANADVAAAGVNALEHYLEAGIFEGRDAYRAVGDTVGDDGFDAQFYLLANADVAAAGLDARFHFDQFGQEEGRDPNALFDVDFYLAENPDVAAAAIDALDHYLAFGASEGRDPSAAFDTSAYVATNGDAIGETNPLVHYLDTVQDEGGPNPDFLIV